MAGEWETARLGDCVTYQKGFAFKSAEYRPNGYPIVRVSNFTDRSIDMAECSYLDHNTVQQYEAYKLRHRDAVIATVGSWPTNPASVVGKTICVPEKAEGALLNQNAVRLRTKADLDQRFLFYLLKQPDFQTYIVGTAQGSASQASITLNDIFAFEFQCPPLADQKAIASILGALDDKIELNRRMNSTLESMARALFQSWFVDFDPVRAKLDGRKPFGMDDATAALFSSSFIETELGHIPNGWQIKTIDEIAERVAMGPFGSDIKVSTFVPEGVPVVSGQHLRGTMLDDSEFNFVSDEHANRLKRSNVQRGDVIFTHAGSIGQVAYIPETSRYERYIISQRQFYLRCNLALASPFYIIRILKLRKGSTASWPILRLLAYLPFPSR